MTSVLHFYFKLNPPIVLQTIMLPLNMMEARRISGARASRRTELLIKKLQRPWMPEEKPNPFADLAKAMSPPPPEKKKSEKEAKKNGEKEDAKRNRQKGRGIYHWVPLYIYLIHSLLLLLVYITRTYSVRMYLRVYLFHLHFIFYLLLSFCMEYYWMRV